MIAEPNIITDILKMIAEPKYASYPFYFLCLLMNNSFASKCVIVSIFINSIHGLTFSFGPQLSTHIMFRIALTN